MKKDVEIGEASTSRSMAFFTTNNWRPFWGRRPWDDQGEDIVNSILELSKDGVSSRSLLQSQTLVCTGFRDGEPSKEKTANKPKALKGQLLLSPRDIRDNVDPLLLADALHSLSGVIWKCNDATKAEFVQSPGGLNGLVSLASQDINPGLQQEALQVLRQLAAVEDGETKAEIVQHTGLLSGLVIILVQNNNLCLQVLSACILMHLAAGNHETKAKIVDHPGVFEGLCQVLSFPNNVNPPLLENVVWALRNLARGDDYIKLKIVNHPEALNGLLILSSDATDPVLQGAAMLALWNLVAGSHRIKGLIAGHIWNAFDELTNVWQIPFEEGLDGVGCTSIFQDFLNELEEFDETDGIEPQESAGSSESIPSKCKPKIFLDSVEVKESSTGDENDIEEDCDDESEDKSFVSWCCQLCSCWPVPELPNHPFDVEVLLKFLPTVLNGKDRSEQQKVLQDLCDLTRAPLDRKTASRIAHQTDVLRGLVSLFSKPSLQGMASLALRNLAASDGKIKNNIVDFLISLAEYSNPLQENAIWGLGIQAGGDDDDIKAKIVDSGVLEALVILVGDDNNPRLQGKATLALRNLADGCGLIKAKICDHPAALEQLVNLFTRDANPPGTKQLTRAVFIEQTWRESPYSLTEAVRQVVIALRQSINFVLTRQQNASFALESLAGRECETAAGNAEHRVILEGVVRVLTQALTRDINPLVQQNAALALGKLAGVDDKAKARIVDYPGALEFLVLSLAKDSNPALQKTTGRTFLLLASSNDEIKSRIVDHPGALEGLVLSVVKHDNLALQRDAVSALRNLAATDGMQTMTKAKIVNYVRWTLHRCHRGMLTDVLSFKGDGGYSSATRLEEFLKELGDEDREIERGTFGSHLGGSKGDKEQRDKGQEEDYVEVGIRSTVNEQATMQQPGSVTDGHLRKLLVSLPENADEWKGANLERKAIRDLCDYAILVLNETSPWSSYQPDQFCDEIVDSARTLDWLAVVIAEDSNPHLQQMATSMLRILIKGSNQTVDKIVDHPGILAGLVTSLTKDNKPSLQEIAVSSLVSMARKVDFSTTVINHPGALAGLVMLLRKDTNPPLQELAEYVLMILSDGKDQTKVKIVTSLKEYSPDDDNASFQRISLRILCELGITGRVQTIAKILDEFPLVLDWLLTSMTDDSIVQKDSATIVLPKNLQVEAAKAIRNITDYCDAETKAKLVSDSGKLAKLVVALSTDSNPDLQVEGVGILLHVLAAADPDTKAKAVDHPARVVAVLGSLLSNTDRVLRRNAALALSNLAAGKDDTKAKIVNTPGVLTGLVMSIYKYESPVLQRNASMGLMYLAEGDSETKAKITYHPGALEGLLLSLNDEKNLGLQEKSASALRNLALAEAHRMKIRSTEGLVEGLIVLLTKDTSASRSLWAATACALTLLDPERGNQTNLNAKESYCGRGRANLELGLYKEALSDLDMADRLQQDDPEENQLSGLHPAIWRYRCTVRKMLGDFPGALADADRIIEVERTPSDLRERGVLKLELGDLDGALNDLDDALPLELVGRSLRDDHDHDYEVLKQRGYVKFLMGNLEGARSDAEWALRINTHLVKQHGCKRRSVSANSVEYLGFKFT